MRTFLLQDWISVAGTARTAVTVTQEQGGWLDVSSSAAATFWIDISQVTNSSGYPVTLSLQTSPTLDESYFTPTAPALTMTAATTPYVVQTLRLPGFAPLSKYLRWQASASFGGNWSASFRIRVALSPENQFVPTDLSGCVLWLRADLGITAVGGTVSGWADQSGSGNNAAQAVGTAQPTYVASAMNGLPAIYGDGAKLWMSITPFKFGPSATLFAAVQPSVSTQSSYARLLEQQYNKTYMLGCDTTGAAYKLIVNDSTPPYGTADGGTVTLAANTVVSGVYSASSGTGGLYVNGALVGSSSFTAPTTDMTDPLAIMQAFGGAGDFWTGYFGEAVVYSRALAPIELARVHRYLGGRYGVVM